MKRMLFVNGVIVSSLAGVLVSKLCSFKKTKGSSGMASKIKGNKNSNGELIYHVPDGKFYEVSRALEWFDTEEAAVAAGYSKSE